VHGALSFLIAVPELRHTNNPHTFVMIVSLQWLLALGAVLAPYTLAQTTDPQLTGIWITKSRKVITGPVRTPCTMPHIYPIAVETSKFPEAEI
jgi:hypothetical protein